MYKKFSYLIEKKKEKIINKIVLRVKLYKNNPKDYIDV